MAFCCGADLFHGAEQLVNFPVRKRQNFELSHMNFEQKNDKQKKLVLNGEHPQVCLRTRFKHYLLTILNPINAEFFYPPPTFYEFLSF